MIPEESLAQEPPTETVGLSLIGIEKYILPDIYKSESRKKLLEQKGTLNGKINQCHPLIQGKRMSA